MMKECDTLPATSPATRALAVTVALRREYAGLVAECRPIAPGSIAESHARAIEALVEELARTLAPLVPAVDVDGDVVVTCPRCHEPYADPVIHENVAGHWPAVFRVGDLVRLVRLDGRGTARVVEVLDVCPQQGCGKAALRVRRLPESFPAWPTDFGVWHQEDTELVSAVGR